jgi:hypothetical protein
LEVPVSGEVGARLLVGHSIQNFKDCLLANSWFEPCERGRGHQHRGAGSTEPNGVAVQQTNLQEAQFLADLKTA